jgi:VWFA-related protein
MKIRFLLLLLCLAMLSLLSAQEKETKYFYSEDEVSYELTREYYLKQFGKNNPLNITLTQFSTGQFPIIQTWNSITDENGNSILGLTASDFTVTENGINAPFSVQQIEGSQSAISVALVIDVSGSMGSSGMVYAKQAALTFVSNMSNFDRAAIIKFSYGASIVQGMTSNKTLLTNAINSLSHGGSTAMYDGFYLGLQQLAPESGTKALIGFTDGDNNAGSYNQSSVINYANQLNVPIYAIGVGSAYATPLQQMASATGGSYYYAPNPSQIGTIYEQISQSIQEQYKIVFNSPNPQLDGTTRLVEISVIHNGNNATTSFTYNAPLDDPNAPVIQLTQSTINLINNSQVEGNPMSISAIISDDQSIASAKLFYKNSNVAFYQDVNLNNSSGNMFEFTIPGNEVVEGAINFYFTASDNEGNSVSLPSLQPFDYPFSIAILPNMPPEIVHEAIMEAAVGKQIEISATVTDNTGVLASVKLLYKNHDVPVYNMIDMQFTDKGTFIAQLPIVTDAHYNLTSPIDQRNGIDYVIKAEDEYGSISYYPADFNSSSVPQNIEVVYWLNNDAKGFFELGEDDWFFQNFNKKNNYGNGTRQLPNFNLYKDKDYLMWPTYLYDDYNYSWALLAPYFTFARQSAWPSWEMMVDAFGDNCFIGGGGIIKQPKPSIVYLWASIFNAVLGDGFQGACFGFGQSTALAFDGYSLPFVQEIHQDLYDLNMNDNTRRCLNSLWTKQWGKETMRKYRGSKPTPKETLNDYKASFSSSESRAMMLWKYRGNIFSQHVVNPFKIERTNEIGVSRLAFYDNTYNVVEYLNIDESSDQISGWTYSHDVPDNMAIFQLPEPSIYLEVQDPLIEFTFKDNDSILFYVPNAQEYDISMNSNFIEFSIADSSLVNNIPGAKELIIATSQFAPPVGWILPNENFVYTDQNQADSSVKQLLLLDGSLMHFYRYANIENDHSGSFVYDTVLKVINDSNDESIVSFGTIEMGIDSKGEFEKVYSVNDFDLNNGDSIGFNLEDNVFSVSNYHNGKQSSKYTSSVSILDSDGIKIFTHSNIEIPGNTTHIISPDWASSFPNMMIFVDYGSNGVIDDTLFLDNQYSLGHILELSNGWSAISSYQNPDEPELENIFAAQISNSSMTIMLGKTGIFWPGQNINTIGNWNPYEGYKVKMNVDDQVVITGEEVVDKTVNLNAGATFLPVLSLEPVPATTIFDQIEDELSFAFDLGGLIYWPDGGIYDLQLLEPGKAYLLSMLADASVTFPESGDGKQLNGNKIRIVENSPWEVTNTVNPHIISIFNAALTDLKQGDIIAAFNAEGACVGVTQFAGEAGNLPLVVYGNDFTTEQIDGLVEGETITLKVYDPMTKKLTEVYPVWDNKMPNTGQFAENGLSAILNLKAGTSVSEPSLSNLSIYPNPNTGVFNVTGINEPVVIHVLNTSGQMIESLTTNQSIEINLSNLAKGIYYLKVISEQDVRIEKIIIK